MGNKKFFCSYCDVYLTTNARSARKAHLEGHKHKNAVVQYYEELDKEWRREAGLRALLAPRPRRPG